MENKIIISLLLVFLLVPAYTQARVIVPTANLTIAVNTQGGDSLFNFNLTECPTIICNNPTQINLQTQNLTASTSTYISAFPGERYYLEEKNIPGLRVSSIFCTSDNSNDVFWYQGNIVDFSPSPFSNVTCTFNNVTAQTKTPVLIVPDYWVQK